MSSDDEFIDKIKALAEYSKVAVEEKDSEMQICLSVVLPFLNALGYDNVKRHIVAEAAADSGKLRGQKIDYALRKDSNSDEILMLVEAKSVKEKNLAAHHHQLDQYYYNRQDAKIALLTNGIEAWFYADLVTPNRMDKEPFFKFNFQENTIKQIEILENFCRENFSTDKAIKLARVIIDSQEFSSFSGILDINKEKNKTSVTKQHEEDIKLNLSQSERMEAGDNKSIDQFKFNYWSNFINYLQDTKAKIIPDNPVKLHILYCAMISKRIQLNTKINPGEKDIKKRKISIEIRIHTGDKDKNKFLFEKIKNKKHLIEEEIDESLDWNEKPEREYSTIVLEKFSDSKNHIDWDNQFAWLKEKLETFYGVFKPIIEDIELNEHNKQDSITNTIETKYEKKIPNNRDKSRHEFNCNYWSNFQNYLATESGKIKLSTPSSYLNQRIEVWGKGTFVLQAYISSKNISVAFYLGGKNEVINENIFNILKKREYEFKSKIIGYTWEPLKENRFSIILRKKADITTTDQENKNNQFLWLKENLELFYDIFYPLTKDIDIGYNF